MEPRSSVQSDSVAHSSRYDSIHDSASTVDLSTQENERELVSEDDALAQTTLRASAMTSTSVTKQPSATQAAQMFVFTNAKAGMEDVDRDHVQKVVFEMSKDSLFFQNSLKQNDKVEARITDMRAKLESLTKARRETLRRQIDSHIAKMEASRELTRTKVVVDMDMFYAAVEMRDNPSLCDKPLAVGGIGMLSTTNYVARKFGVRAAMPGFIGKELCPDLVIVPPNFVKYTAIAAQIREIVEKYDPNFRAMSLDEVYCDITDFMEVHWPRYARTGATAGHFTHSSSDGSDDDEDTDRSEGDELVGESSCSDGHVPAYDETNDHAVEYHHGVSVQVSQNHFRKRQRAVTSLPRGKREDIAAAIVGEIRLKIFKATKLTASAGIAANTMLAKICSDFNKPNGQFVLPFSRDDVLAFLDKLSVRKVGGIGKVMEKTLSAVLEITTAKDLYDRRVELFHLFSERTAVWLLRISLGIQSPDSDESKSGRKSYSRERTFAARGIGDPITLEKICAELCAMLANDMAEGSHGGKTLTLKLKCVDFSVRTRAVSSSRTVRFKDELYASVVELLRKEMPLRLRLMGVRASGLVDLDDKTVVGGESQTRKRQALIDRFTTNDTVEEGTVSDTVDAPAEPKCLDTLEDTSSCEENESSRETGNRETKRQLGITEKCHLQEPGYAKPPTQEQEHSEERARKRARSMALVDVDVRERVASDFHPCPICGKMINAGNAIAVDVHVEACLRQSQGDTKRRTFQQFFQS